MGEANTSVFCRVSWVACALLQPYEVDEEESGIMEGGPTFLSYSILYSVVFTADGSASIPIAGVLCAHPLLAAP